MRAAGVDASAAGTAAETAAGSGMARQGALAQGSRCRAACATTECGACTLMFSIEWHWRSVGCNTCVSLDPAAVCADASCLCHSGHACVAAGTGAAGAGLAAGHVTGTGCVTAAGTGEQAAARDILLQPYSFRLSLPRQVAVLAAQTGGLVRCASCARA